MVKSSLSARLIYSPASQTGTRGAVGALASIPGEEVAGGAVLNNALELPAESIKITETGIC